MREYFFCKPGHAVSLDEQWDECLDQLAKIAGSGWQPVKLIVFIRAGGVNDFIDRRRKIGNSLHSEFPKSCPAFNVIAQPPLGGGLVSAEVLAVKTGSGSCVYKSYGNLPYVVVDSQCGKELFAAGLGDGMKTDNTRASSQLAFDQMMDILMAEGMTLDNVIRQWNYVGNILQMRNGFQNYQVFNEVRSESYDKFRHVRGFPAATGVGSMFGGFFLDFHAIVSEVTTSVIPLCNPDQANAYDYNQEVLIGLESEGKKLKNPPKFERALILSCKDETILFVSGTASIIGQETIGPDDVARQTEVTIGNIRKLTDLERIRKMTGREDLNSLRIICSRIYIKNGSDLMKVKSVCGSEYREDSGTFVEADICRNDLLVEIEAEFLVEKN